MKKIHILGTCLTKNPIVMANDKPFKPDVGNAMSESEAKQWIRNYDKLMRPDKSKDTQSVFFGRDTFDKILNGKNKKEVAGITIFLALKSELESEKHQVKLVLVPTREDGKLIWKSKKTIDASLSEADTLSASSVEKAGAQDDDSYDNGMSCPPYCPKDI